VCAPPSSHLLCAPPRVRVHTFGQTHSGGGVSWRGDWLPEAAVPASQQGQVPRLGEAPRGTSPDVEPATAGRPLANKGGALSAGAWRDPGCAAGRTRLTPAPAPARRRRDRLLSKRHGGVCGWCPDTPYSPPRLPPPLLLLLLLSRSPPSLFLSFLSFLSRSPARSLMRSPGEQAAVDRAKMNAAQTRVGLQKAHVRHPPPPSYRSPY